MAPLIAVGRSVAFALCGGTLCIASSEGSTARTSSMHSGANTGAKTTTSFSSSTTTTRSDEFLTHNPPFAGLHQAAFEDLESSEPSSSTNDAHRNFAIDGPNSESRREEDGGGGGGGGGGGENNPAWDKDDLRELAERVNDALSIAVGEDEESWLSSSKPLPPAPDKAIAAATSTSGEVGAEHERTEGTTGLYVQDDYVGRSTQESNTSDTPEKAPGTVNQDRSEIGVQNVVAVNQDSGDVGVQNVVKTTVGTGEPCGKGEYRKTCGKGEGCCNSSCGICAPRGQSCLQIVCGGLKRGGGLPKVHCAQHFFSAHVSLSTHLL